MSLICIYYELLALVRDKDVRLEEHAREMIVSELRVVELDRFSYPERGITTSGKSVVGDQPPPQW